jgi:MtrB/PioB family decaheme-associated outer membrane protein
MKKTLLLTVALLGAARVFAQAPAQTAVPQTAGTDRPKLQVSGSVTTGVQQLDNATNSSKLTEYRDIGDSVYVPRVSFSVGNPERGWFFDARAVNAGRDDQGFFAAGGRPGVWNVVADWSEVPHNFSNRALSPYTMTSPGRLELPATVPITFKKLATSTAADVPGVLASDQLIAAYQNAFLAPIALGTQTNSGRIGASWSGSDALSVEVDFHRRDKSGSRSTFGPIGDRPPRTLNIQLAEPVDYRTNDLTVAAEHQGGGYQLRGEYLFSDFANSIDTLQWQNAFTNALPGATYDAWDRAVSVQGVRPLAPDNRYHNVTGMFGLDLPYDSRLVASAGYGRLEQNETLLPYSYNQDLLVVKSLPRATAEGLVRTTSVTADYVIAPVPRVNVRAFYRWYDLDNRTPSSQWQYITSDTSSLTGTSSYVNKRVSLPYAWDRQNAGAEATVRLPARSTLNLGFEREAVGRVHREADTAENIVRASWRTRLTRRASIDARYLYGSRDGGQYNNNVTREGYWYTLAEANDNNNPAFTFDNHPDMRRYDVSDRARQQFDVRVNLTPVETVSLSASVRRRTDDFDSEVTSTQPLAGTAFADAAAATPGDQLGLLDSKRTRYAVDLFIQPAPRLSLNAFVNLDTGTSLTRSIEFNENNKANPSAILTAELGPWTRGSSQWTADVEDRTWTGGLGGAVQLVPDRVSLTADYTTSLADVKIGYRGFGLTNFDGTPFAPTHQFGFSTAPDIREDWRVLNLRLEWNVKTVTLIAGYTYEDYALEDWQQGSTTPWVEAVGSDTLLRDSSQSYQWGNRLFNLGTYLAPSFDAHIGFVGVRYRF